MQALHHLHASTCAIFFLENNQSRLVVPISHGYLSHELMQSSFPLNEETPSGFVTLSQQMLVISDLGRPAQLGEPELLSRRGWLQKNGYRALLRVTALYQSRN